MRVKLNIGLDFEGNHTFAWYEDDTPGSLEVPKAVLERWTREHETISAALSKWQRVMEDVEDVLHKNEVARQTPAEDIQEVLRENEAARQTAADVGEPEYANVAMSAVSPAAASRARQSNKTRP